MVLNKNPVIMGDDLPVNGYLTTLLETILIGIVKLYSLNIF